MSLNKGILVKRHRSGISTFASFASKKKNHIFITEKKISAHINHIKNYGLTIFFDFFFWGGGGGGALESTSENL